MVLMSDVIWILGDNHGVFEHILEIVEVCGERPAAVIFLGDLECPVPFSDCVAEIEAAGIECWVIPGNHDTDTSENYLNLFGDTLFQERNLHGCVVEIAGLRIAGLGGIFREKVWDPDRDEMPAIRNWQKLVATQNAKRPTRLRIDQPTVEQIASDSVLRKHSSTIFYDDWFHLYGQRADILVTHEAPDCHEYGYKAITSLAQSLKVKFAFHGHMHEDKRYNTEYLGFQAAGVGFCGITDQYGGLIRVGEFGIPGGNHNGH